ncbi:MAG: type II toxin-antitoxin system RelE/ParE family toxin [Candidatus Acidiferrales bacterium]
MFSMNGYRHWPIFGPKQGSPFESIDWLQAAGNFGNCKSLGKGIYELRIDWGPGYRVHYALIGPSTALLLYGGDKRTQARDIARAQEYLSDYKGRTEKK